MKNDRSTIRKHIMTALLTAALLSLSALSAAAAQDGAQSGASSPAAVRLAGPGIPEQAETQAETQADGQTGGEAAELAAPEDRIAWDSCRIEGGRIVFRAHLAKKPSEVNAAQFDDSYYVMELEPYEDSVSAGGGSVARLPKHTGEYSFDISVDGSVRGDRLYNRFVFCVRNGSEYFAVSDPVYITNPEVMAADQSPYDAPFSKKGLLVEHALIDDAFYLGVSNVIVNIAFNQMFGSGIDYVYDGETYHFDSAVVSSYDRTISAFSNKNMNVNVVLLNGWNPSAPDFFYPGAKKTSSAAYYMFNASTARGYKNLRAVASFLAKRYSGKDPKHGRVQNWIVGNEINNQYWNYIGPMGIRSYAGEFERGFRVLYTAIRSSCANDRVYFSLDHNWNRQADGRLRYNGRDMLDTLSGLIRLHGNIDWGLAYHPYSEPLTEPEFWDDFQTGQVNFHNYTPVINFANLSVLTEYMKRETLLDRSGNVRHIILSEQGFTSMSATRGKVEDLQAAAFAYAYYIVDSNPYIDSFILSRQVDAPSEVSSSLAFGLWTADYAADGSLKPGMRKKIWQVFKDIDRQKNTLETTAFAKELLGINNWSDVIPGFRWERLERGGY